MRSRARLAALLLFLGLSTAAFRLRFFSESDIAREAATQYEEVKRTERILSNGAKFDAVQRVAGFVTRAAARPDFAWEVVVIDSDAVANAWCMPGGKMAVYTGILPVAQNEAGLAAILGHEVAHATLRHANERLSQVALFDLLGRGLDSRLRESRRREAWMKVFGVGSTLGVLLPYSRSHEHQADLEGLRLMARAGYDPEEAPLLWDRMNAAGGARPPVFLSTHPDPRQRAARLRANLPEAKALYDAASVKQPRLPLP